MYRVYFLTSYHYYPERPDSSPLCQVWIGDESDHAKTFGRVYKSYNLPKMLRLAFRIANDRGFPLTALSVDIKVVEVYSRERGPP